MADIKPFLYRTKIYYEDTDAGGIVYYANYLRYAERGRTEMLAALGLSNQKILADTGTLITVRHCTVDYLRPARLEDLIRVETCVQQAVGARLSLQQIIYDDSSNDILVKMEVTLACLDENTRPKRIPPLVLDGLKPYLMQES